MMMQVEKRIFLTRCVLLSLVFLNYGTFSRTEAVTAAAEAAAGVAVAGGRATVVPVEKAGPGVAEAVARVEEERNSLQGREAARRGSHEGAWSSFFLQDAEGDLHPDLRVSPPCPNADDIFPCTCMNYSQGRTYVSCDGITDETYASRALHSQGFGASPIASFSMTAGTVQTIHNGLFDEHSFEDIYLYDNQITFREPGALEPLRYDLKMLNVDDNKLTHHIVDQVVNFPTLYEIHMGNNLIDNISSMADIEGSIPSLRVIDFAGNLLTQVPPHVCRALPNVLMVILSDNLISYVHPAAFIGLEMLDYIYLDGNNLNHLGSADVGKIVVSRQIFRLDLARNEIDSLVPGFAEGLGDDSSLVLDNNPMEHFPKEVFGNLLKNMSISDAPWSYHGIDIYHNWLVCDCDFLWVAEDGWLNAHLFGGHCGNKTEWPWISIDDVDAEALALQCHSTSTFEPPPPHFEG